MTPRKKLQLSILLTTVLIGCVFFVFNKKIRFKADNMVYDGTTQVANLTTNIGSYPSSEVPRYEKFELTFDINRLNTAGGSVVHSLNQEIEEGLINPYWPYDESPVANTDHPDAVPAGIGISVDGLFLSPDKNGVWGENDANAVVQPGFIYQDFESQINVDGGDWLYPQNNKIWKIRFAPTEVNSWQYKIRITDASGVTCSTPSSFDVINSTNKGFVKASSNDSRYFETSSGDYVNLTGLNYDETSMTKANSIFPELKDGGINLIRNWWQGSQGPAVFGIGGRSGIRGGDGGWDNIQKSEGSDAYLSTVEARGIELLSGKFALSQSDTSVTKNASTNANVIEGKTYKFSVYVKTKNVSALNGNSKFYLAAYGVHMNQEIKSLLFDQDHDWTEISGTYTIPTGYNITSVDLKVGVIGMKLKDEAFLDDHGAWFTDASLKEDLGGGSYGPEMIAVPNFGAQNYINQREAFKADYITDLAKENNIYLNIVVEETVDPVFQRILSDGSATSSASKANVYADNTSANRVYQMYYWRYLMARYNYSTALHSFELFNEGDINSAHANALEAFASYMKKTLNSNHLTTSSLSRDFKSKTFWSLAPDIGYATWHKYISTAIGGHDLGWLDNDLDARLTSEQYYSAPNSIKISTVNNSSKVSVHSVPIPVIPGHQYKLSWKVSSQNMVPEAGCRANAGMTFKSGSETEIDTTAWLRSNSSLDVNSNIGWTADEMTQYAISNPSFSTDDSKYVVITMISDFCTGDIYFDDVEFTDLTTGAKVNFPNSNFDSSKTMVEDTALITYGIGSQIGRIFESSAVSPKVPVILGETGLSDPARNTDYPNPELILDTDGIWYKKFIWGGINPYSIIGLYYGNAQTYDRDPSFLGYSKAYQNFMSGIKLNNGNYQDALATTNNYNLRVWGQKEMTGDRADRAHLWIDNAPYTWKNIVDGNIPSVVSGSVTIPEMENGDYQLEWWDTSSGSVVKNEFKLVSDNSLTFDVSGLVSDIALKIIPANPKIKIVSPINGSATLNESVAVKYTVNDGVEQNQNFDLVVGVNNLTIEASNPFNSAMRSDATIQVTRKKSYVLNSNNFSNSWNMVSFPYLASLISKNLPTGYKIREYNSAANSYDNLEGTDTALGVGVGYWIKIDDTSKFNDFRYEAQSSPSIEMSVIKGWNFLGNPFDTELPLANLSVKYKDGTVRSYVEAIARRDLVGYVWSWEASSKEYFLVAINPNHYRTSAKKTNNISPFRGFWALVKSDNVDGMLMNK